MRRTYELLIFNSRIVKTGIFSVLIGLMIFGFTITSVFAEGNGEGLFLDPVAITVDSNGFVYVVDSYNSNTVQKFDSNGKFLSMWKTRNVDNNTMFDRPVGIAVDSTDNVYVVSSAHDKIKKLSDSGYIADSFGKRGYEDENGETIGGEFSRPLHIAIDSKDDIYVTDYGAEAVQKFSNDGTFILKWGSKGTGDGQFDMPVGIAVDSTDSVYVLDEHLGVQKFSPDGTFIAKWETSGSDDDWQFLQASGIAVDSSDIVYVADYGKEYLQKFSSEGRFIEKISLRSDKLQNSYSGTTSISVDDSTGNFYITNGIDKTASKFSPNGTLLVKWGGEYQMEPSDKNNVKKMQNKPGNGIYTKNELFTQFLELGKEADIVFAINEERARDAAKVITRYQILDTQDEPFDTGDTREFRFDSLSSDKFSLPFSPQELGSFFLKQGIEYSNDQELSSGGSSSTTQFHVVEKFNKKTNEDGLCTKSGMISLFKPDFSTNVCVTPENALKIMNRWY